MSGAASAPTVPADAGYFEDLRERATGGLSPPGLRS